MHESMNTQDLIALAKQCGARLVRPWDADEVVDIQIQPAQLEAFCAALAAAQPKADEPTGPDWHKIADERAAEIVRLTTKADERGSAEPIPFGFWHQGETEEESDFFLYSESGEVGCVMCVNLYEHPTPYTAPARDGSEPGPYVENWREPHPASRLCMCPACAPSFDDRFEPPPEQRAEPQGLTDEQIALVWQIEVGRDHPDTIDKVRFAKAILRLAARASAGRADK